MSANRNVRGSGWGRAWREARDVMLVWVVFLAVLAYWKVMSWWFRDKDDDYYFTTD